MTPFILTELTPQRFTAIAVLKTQKAEIAIHAISAFCLAKGMQSVPFVIAGKDLQLLDDIPYSHSAFC